MADLSDWQCLHADDDLLVVDKPAGMLSVPGRGPDKQDCLLARVQQRYPQALVVHRLDQATSGLMLFALNTDTQRQLSMAFEARQVEKTYMAWVEGLLPVSEDWQTIDLPIQADWERRPLRIIAPAGQASQTRWRCIAHHAEGTGSLLELQPLTGRTHQLRVHLQAIGHPIWGDRLYAPLEVQKRSPRLMLHAHTLAFTHPRQSIGVRFQLPVNWGQIPINRHCEELSLRGTVIASVAKQSLDCRVAYAPRNDNEKKQHTKESNTSMTQLTILTGASRGMGLAMAEQLCTPHHTLLCISRGSSEALTTLAQKNGTTLIQWQADLAQPEAVADKLKVWLQTLNGPTFSQAVLINNAGVIGHLGPIEQATASSVQQALAINLAAPILLTQVFLQATRAWPAKRKVLQISSGLGRRAMAASAVYCATKAGLDHFSRSAALDEALLSNPAQMVSIAPGVIDTDMQTDLRSGNPTGFPDQSNFIQLKQSGSLTSPADAAARLLAFLARGDFGSNVVADVRD